MESGLAFAVNLTFVTLWKATLQSDPQLIPAGLLVTVPSPVPVFTTVRLYSPSQLNVAVTDLPLSIVTTQSPVPEHAPDQPAKADPDERVAVNVTDVPSVNDALQVEPQSIPEGVLITVPSPVPSLET